MGIQPVVRQGWQDTNCWTTGAVRPDKQFDYWCDFVNQAYLSWSIPRTSCDVFPAYIREGRFDGCRLTNLTSAQPQIKGTRGTAEIARDSEALYNLLYIAAGTQNLVIDRRPITLGPGHFVLWDTTRPMTFVTGERLRQITLTIPHHRLHRALPQAAACVGKPMYAGAGLSRLFAENLLSLDAHFGDLTLIEAPRILDAAIELLATTLESAVPQCREERQPGLLRDIQAYIQRHLADPGLGLAGIAGSHGISLRHLHRLFAETDTTVANWILHRRLERCQRDLASAEQSDTSITTIALRWGLADSSTFSKAFKRRFGVSPRAFRAAGPARRV
jgi:AraC-like DNA-binding protein